MTTSEQKAYAGVKWGIHNPAVIVVGLYTLPPADKLELVDEFYRAGVILDDLIVVARDLQEHYGIRCFFCDPSEPKFIERFRKESLAAKAMEDQEGAAINLINARFKNQKAGEPGGLVVSRKCEKTIAEFGLFRMPERDPRRPFRDKPLDLDNYAMGALKYLVLGIAYEGTPRVRWL